MENPAITKEVWHFLKELQANNNREWFTEHKAKYKAAELVVSQFSKQLLKLLQQHDEIEKLKKFRIYRDVRFSADKTPYKSHFAVSYSRSGASRRGGYYLRLKPGGTFIAAGFWEPDKKDLLRIRQELARDAEELRQIIGRKDFSSIWGSLQGEEVKTAPKGFSRDHADIDLIRKKQFIFVREFKDRQVLDNSFLEEVDHSFRAIRPYFDFMSDVLTTDLNGASLI